jgi:Flp pilus assembly protein TadD
MATANTSETHGSRRHEFFGLAFLLALTVVCYLDGIAAPFVLDDFRGIVWRPSLQSLHFGDMWQDNPNRVVPFFIFSMILRLFGPTPPPFHMLSLGLHLTAVILVYQIVRSPGLTSGSRTPLPSLIGAAVFALHPLQSQAVLYSWQGLTIMAAVLMLLSIRLYLRSQFERPSGTSTGLSLAAMLLAGFCKQIAVLVPVMLLVCTVIVGKSNLTAALRKTWPWFIVAAVIALPGLFIDSQEMRDIQSARLNGTLLTSWHYLLTQQVVIAKYLQLLVWPAGLTIDHHVLPVLGLADPRLWLGLAVHAGLIGGALAGRRTHPVAAAGILLFYTGLALESSILPLEDLMFEHRLYTPMLGIACVAADLTASGARIMAAKTQSLRFAAAASAAVVAIAMVSVTSQRVGIWSSRESLWADAAEKAPQKRRSQVNYGMALVAENKFLSAVHVLRHALTLDGPPDSRLYDALGNAYAGTGETDKAEEAFRQSVTINPGDAFAWKSYGVFLARSERFAEAVAAFTRARTIHTNDPHLDRMLEMARASAQSKSSGEPAAAAPGKDQ